MPARPFAPLELPSIFRIARAVVLATLCWACPWMLAAALGQAPWQGESPLLYRLPPVEAVFAPPQVVPNAIDLLDAADLERLPLTTLEPEHGQPPTHASSPPTGAPYFVMPAEGTIVVELDEPPEMDEKPVKLWSASFELGINGSDGNSQTTNFRLGAELERKSKYNTLQGEVNYRRSQQQSKLTEDRLFYEGSSERNFDDSLWTIFIHGTLEYDDFKSFDSRLTADAGIGYRIWKDDVTTLTGRFSGGFSHEVGGPDDRYVPEANYSLNLERQISERQKLVVKVNYIPGIEGGSHYRFNTKADWIVNLDKEMHLNIKFSVADRYDSTPNGAKPNDLDYSAVLLWDY